MVQVLNAPKLSMRAWFDGNLPTRLNWSGCQRDFQWVHLSILIMLSFLLFQKCIFSKSLNQHPVITSCMICSLQYRLFWNPCFSLDILYFCLSRQSIVLWCAQNSAHCLDYPSCKTKDHWWLVDAHIQDGEGSMPLLFFQLKVANTSFIDVCNQFPLR